jgi:hypothetical protein
MSSPDSLTRILDATVRVGGIRVGRVSGILFDASGTRVIGLEVASPDGARRFLPWVAATIANGDVWVRSALQLVDWSDTYERDGALVSRSPAEVEGTALPAREGPRAAGGRGPTGGPETPTTYARAV